MVVRAVRQHQHLRQADLAIRAGVSQRWVSQVELGRLHNVSLPVLERICTAIGIDIRLELRWRGGELDRLIDHDHAAIIEAEVRRLIRDGWEIRLEYGFNHYGERGSVDILAWHAGTRSLLIIEVKTRLADLQALLSSLARKLRIVPDFVRRDGWVPERTAYLLVVLGTSVNRRVIAAHRAMFEESFPHRGPQVAAWLGAPSGMLRGLQMISPRTVAAGSRRGVRRRRIRRPGPIARPSTTAGR